MLILTKSQVKYEMARAVSLSVKLELGWDIRCLRRSSMEEVGNSPSVPYDQSPLTRMFFA